MFGTQQEQRTITLDLIRHGEPEGGVRYRGSVDDPLSETGWQQMRHATEQARTAGAKWEAVISSPMLRCHEFAVELSDSLNLPLTTHPDLRELCFGDLEGLTPQEAWAREPELLKNLWADPVAHTPKGGEPFADFMQRVASALDNMLQTTLQTNGARHLLVVVHGGVIRAALCHFLHMTPQDSFRVEVPYAGMSRIKVYLDADGQSNAALNFINRFTGNS